MELVEDSPKVNVWCGVVLNMILGWDCHRQHITEHAAVLSLSYTGTPAATTYSATRSLLDVRRALKATFPVHRTSHQVLLTSSLWISLCGLCEAQNLRQ
jgi:hypothetical protein